MTSGGTNFTNFPENPLTTVYAFFYQTQSLWPWQSDWMEAWPDWGGMAGLPPPPGSAIGWGIGRSGAATGGHTCPPKPRQRWVLGFAEIQRVFLGWSGVWGYQVCYLILLGKCVCQLQIVYVFLVSAGFAPDSRRRSASEPRWGGFRPLDPIYPLYLRTLATSLLGRRPVRTKSDQNENRFYRSMHVVQSAVMLS